MDSSAATRFSRVRFFPARFKPSTKALEAGKIEIRRTGLAHQVLVFADDRNFGHPGIGDHLRNHHANAVVAKLVGKRFAADKGYVEELSRDPVLFGLADH